MDPFSLTLGTLAIITACSQSAKVLIRLYEDQRSAESDIAESLLKLKTTWYKIEKQMEFLRKIWDTLDPNYQSSQLLLLSKLEHKLQQAYNQLNRVIGAKSGPTGLSGLLEKKGSLKKGLYIFSVKGSLAEILSEISEWREQFDPSWYLLSRVHDSYVDQSLGSQHKDESLKLLNALRKSVQDLTSSSATLTSKPIPSRDFLERRAPIALSSVAIATIEGRLQQVLVNTMDVKQAKDALGTSRNVAALAKALSRMDPLTFGLLRCCGLIHNNDSYEFVFEIPPELQYPRSLRDLLSNPPPSLNAKVELAKQLSKSVFFVHATGFVHKNIRPENIIIFDHGEDKSLFLCGFESFRGTNDDTFKVGDALPERNLYRHPLRQGNDPEQRYVMQHDIYSLGVCLLEIGLWKSFVRIENDQAIVEFGDGGDQNDTRKKAFAVKQQILTTTTEQLAQKVGNRFKDIVETCLTCLDDDTTWYQGPEDGTSEVQVGVEYIENVLSGLCEIVV